MQTPKLFKLCRNGTKYTKFCANFGRFVRPRTSQHQKIGPKLEINEAVSRLGCTPQFISRPLTESVDVLTFERACDETLESLTDYFEEIVELSDTFKTADVSYSTGVLTVNLGEKYGTYVINRQSPNKQIWLSSPQSGPKRYDFVPRENCWIYKHDGQSLHQLLQQEISEISPVAVDFAKCSYSKL